MKFGLELQGELKARLRFEQFPLFAHDRLLAALQDIEQRLEAAVLADEPEKSGALRALTGGRVYDNGTSIAARVGVRAETQDEALKAAALEYGSRKQAITVKAHKASLSHIWSRAISAIAVDVPDHTRTPNVQAHRFLRGPLDTVRSDAMNEMRDALDAATGDANAL